MNYKWSSQDYTLVVLGLVTLWILSISGFFRSCYRTSPFYSPKKTIVVKKKVTLPKVKEVTGPKIQTFNLIGDEKVEFIEGSFGAQLVTYIQDAQAEIDKIFTLDGVTFNSGSATISEKSNAQINKIKQVLNAYPLVEIKAIGHTDSTGNADSNLALSKSRAAAFKNALVQAGIVEARIITDGVGSAQPVASNETQEGQKQNRRIDVQVTKK